MKIKTMRASTDASLLDLVKAQREIEQALGITVELLTPEDIPESFRNRVLGQAKPYCSRRTNSAGVTTA
jgi:predicted nucleotidyltransferase